jgi:hypothetical protein
VKTKSNRALVNTKHKQIELIQLRTARSQLRAPKTIQVPIDKHGRPHNLLPNTRTSKSFRDLMRYFFIPLMNGIEDSANDINTGSLAAAHQSLIADKLALIFGTHYRDIVMAAAIEDFTMLGKQWRTPDQPNDQVPPELMAAKVLKGTPLMIRIDTRMPDRIDVERCDSVDGIVFTLTKVQYQHILPHISEITKANHRLKV